MRYNAILADKDGNIKQIITSMRMIVDCLEVTYITGQSINNGCFSSTSVFANHSGDNRVFLVEQYGRSVKLKHLLPPRTFDEVDKMREIVDKFNGYKS